MRGLRRPAKCRVCPRAPRAPSRRHARRDYGRQHLAGKKSLSTWVVGVLGAGKPLVLPHFGTRGLRHCQVGGDVPLVGNFDDLEQAIALPILRRPDGEGERVGRGVVDHRRDNYRSRRREWAARPPHALGDGKPVPDQPVVRRGGREGRPR